jgi:glucan phosphorylase
VNPRKWIHNCNRELSKLITEQIEDESEWLTHLQLLRPLIAHINYVPGPDTFFARFMKIRYGNKQNLLKFLREEKKDPKFLEGWDLSKTMFEGYLRKIL